MAKGYYQNLYDNLFKGSGRISKLSANTTAGKQASADKSIENLKTRFNAAGVEADTDKRNFVEKALNLPEDQNLLFDVFDILNRPQQAIFGGVKSAQEGGSFLEGAGKGISGKEYTRGKELLHNAGGYNSGDKFGIDDVAGFVLELAADPVDIALIPFTGGGNLAVDAARQGAKGLKVASDAVDAGKALSLVKDVSKAGSTIADGAKMAKTLDTLKDASSVATKTVKMKSLNDVLFNAAGKGIKAGFKASDNVIEGVLKLADDVNLKKGTTSSLLDSYKDIKTWFKKAFDSSANLSDAALKSARKADADTTRVMLELTPLKEKISNNISDAARSIAKKAGDTSDEAVEGIAKQLDSDVMNLKEYLASENRTATMRDVIDMAERGQLKYTEEIGDKLNNLFKDISGVQLGFKVDEKGFVKFDDNWKMIKKNVLETQSFDKALLDEAVKVPTNYSDEDIKALEALKDRYNKDADFKNLYDSVDNVFNEANAIVDKHFGTKLAEVYKDNEGYVRHALDNNMLEKGSRAAVPEDAFRLKGNTKILGDRNFKMSAREANNLFREKISKNFDKLSAEGKAYVRENSKMFSELLTASFDDYMNNIPKIAKDNKVINEILIKQTFGDYQELEKLNRKIEKMGDTVDSAVLKQRDELAKNVNMVILKDASEKAPMGLVSITGKAKDKLINKLNEISKELGTEEIKSFTKAVSKKGEVIAIQPDILRLISIDYRKDATAIGKAYDAMLNFFKRNKTLSPTFQMNNAVGNWSNMALGGVSLERQAVLYPKAVALMSESQNLMKKAASGVELSADEAAKLKIWNNFIDEGFGLQDINKDIYNITGKPSKVNVLSRANMWANQQMDTASRLVMFMEASSNPKLLEGLNVKSAGDAVRKALFDPGQLSEFEQTVMKRIVPFYTFTKKNLMYHLGNLTENGSRYHRLVKAYNNTLNSITGDNGENVSEFIKNNMYIPILGTDENGDYVILRTTIPFGNVIDMLDDPLGGAVSMLSPMIKTPIELATGNNAFTGQPIEKFPGEMSSNIPFLTKKQEYVLGGTTGLDVPLKQGSKMYQGINDTLSQGGNVMQGIGSGVQNALTMRENIETDKLYKTYDELDELENLMKKYKQRGVQFSTMTELRQSNKNSLTASIMAKLNKINGIK